MKEIVLGSKFLSQFDDFPSHMNALGKFVYLRTYSRFLPEKGRRETWKETCKRAVEYNVNLARKHIEKFDIPITYQELKKEAEDFFTAMFNLEQFLSGRTLWIGGAETGVGEKFPCGNFNCSFITIEKWNDLVDMLYLLLVGVGVGFKQTPKMAENMAPVRDNFTITHRPYKDLYSEGVRVDNTSHFAKGNKAIVYIGDSKEGWCEALGLFFRLISEKEFENITEIEFVYDYIRPHGTKLKTFGGQSSGHLPLMEMFSNMEKIIKNQLDPTLEPPERIDDKYVKLRPIHILDFGNLLGNNVVAGGVRRTSEIFLVSWGDWESTFAKYGINGFWSEEQFQKHDELMKKAERLGIKVPKSAKRVGIRKHGVVYTDGAPAKQFDTKEEAVTHAEATGGSYLFPMNLGTGFEHRRMSNNSIAFTEKPAREELNFVMEVQRWEGEPAVVNMEELARRRLHAMGIYNIPRPLLEAYMEKCGLNPCGEVLLERLGLCNLTTINVTRFVKNGQLNRKKLMEAQRRSARAGVRMTLVDLELPHWSQQQQKDRNLGLSLTGWKDMVDMIGLSKKGEKFLLKQLKQVGREDADAYARKLRVNAPLLVTTTKPEGTQSQVCGGVSSGLHYSHSEYYIRRIRISAVDPLAKAVLQHKGWVVNPETGTPGDTREEQLKNARTLVIDFPVYSGATVTKDDIDVYDQFETYFMFQDNYTEHNASNTISLRPDEWETAERLIWENWEKLIGVTFIAHDGGTYELTPYETITKERYEELKNQMQDFDIKILEQFETGNLDDADVGGSDPDCTNGACPPR